MDILSAEYCCPRNSAVRVVLPETGAALFSEVDSPDVWAAIMASGVEIAPYTAPPPPVPTSISDRQFAQQLAIDGVITEAEALAWAARGDLPDALEAIVSQMDDQEFGARMLLSAATAYERGHPLTATLGGLLGYDAAQLDALWQAASAL